MESCGGAPPDQTPAREGGGVWGAAQATRKHRGRHPGQTRERGRHTSATAPNAATPEAAPHPPRLVGRAAPRPERRISTYPALHRLFGGEVWLFQLVEQVRRGHEPVVPVRRLELGQQRGEARVRHGVGRDTPAGAATISRVHHRPRRTTAGTTSRGGPRAAPTGERRQRGWWCRRDASGGVTRQGWRELVVAAASAASPFVQSGVGQGATSDARHTRINSDQHGVKERPHSGERNGDVSNGVPSPEYGQINWFLASPKTCSREGFPSDTCVSFQILAKAF